MKIYYDRVKRFQVLLQKYLKLRAFIVMENVYIMMSRALYFDGALNVRYGPHICFCALIKKKIKFSSFIRKLRMEQLQSHI
jgi:hypothetical protein